MKLKVLWQNGGGFFHSPGQFGQSPHHSCGNKGRILLAFVAQAQKFFAWTHAARDKTAKAC